MTPIVRQTSSRERKYYICSTYNTKGRRYCSKAHLIEEQDLMEDVVNYIQLCRDSLSEMISTYDMKDFESEKKSVEEKRSDIQKMILEQKKQLKTLFSQKVKDLAVSQGNEEIINETYNSLQQDILAAIHSLELQLDELNNTKLETVDVRKKLKTALEVVDDIIQKGMLDRKDIEILVERIMVDENGLPEIELKYGLSGLIKYSPAEELNRRENTIIYTTLQLILEDIRGYTSAKYLSAKLTDAGFKKSKKSVLPYIGLMIDMGVIKPSDNSLKPYTIVKTPAEIKEIMAAFQQNISSDSTYDQNLHLYMVNRRHAGNGI